MEGVRCTSLEAVLLQPSTGSEIGVSSGKSARGRASASGKEWVMQRGKVAPPGGDGIAGQGPGV